MNTQNTGNKGNNPKVVDALRRTGAALGELQKQIRDLEEAMRSTDIVLIHEPSNAAEMAEDIAAYDAARADSGEVIPAEVVERLVAGDNAIKVFREWRGRKQNDVAAATDTTAAYLSQLETGHRGASIDLLRRIADELGVDFGVLIDWYTREDKD
jgi:hypothetical protein